MLFFILSLLISVILTTVIVTILTKTLTVNWERKNRHPLSFLMPVVLTVILLYLSVTLTVPCLLDSVAVVAKTCILEEITLEQGAVGQMTVQVGERLLHYNPRQFKFAAGRSFRVLYTPRSHFILEVTEIGENRIQ